MATSTSATRVGATGSDLPAGVWRLADPKISLASMASILLGTCAAAANGPVSWGWLAVLIVGIFALEVAKNASGEVYDFRSGTDRLVSSADRSPFSGGKRVLVDGLLSERQTWAIAGIGYGIGIAAGLAIALFREPDVLWIGLVGVACAFFYHAPPISLSYRGLGELAVGLCYGPLVCCGTYLVLRGTLAPEILLLATPLGLLIAAFLWINEMPDFTADRTAGKRNLVVRLGRRRAGRFLSLLVLVAFALLVPISLKVAPGALLGLVGLGPAIPALRRAWTRFDLTPELVPAQGLVLLAFLLMAAGSGAGLVLGSPVAW